MISFIIQKLSFESSDTEDYGNKGLSNHSRKEKPNFGQFIKNLVIEQENGNHDIIFMERLVEQSGIEKRRLADLFSALTALGVCSRIQVACYKWLSMEKIAENIKNISFILEKNSLTIPVAELFDAAHSLSIGDLSIKLIEVFVYFGIREMTLKAIATICTINSSGSKQVLRRLYLVAYLLEQLGILTHTTIRGVYRCELNLKEIITDSINELIKQRIVPDISIEMLLSRVDDAYILSILDRRQLIYNSIISKKANDKSSKLDRKPYKNSFALKSAS